MKKRLVLIFGLVALLFVFIVSFAYVYALQCPPNSHTWEGNTETSDLVYCIPDVGPSGPVNPDQTPESDTDEDQAPSEGGEEVPEEEECDWEEYGNCASACMDAHSCIRWGCTDEDYEKADIAAYNTCVASCKSCEGETPPEEEVPSEEETPEEEYPEIKEPEEIPEELLRPEDSESLYYWDKRIREELGEESPEVEALEDCVNGMQAKLTECSQKEGWSVDNQMSITDFKTNENYEIKDTRRGGCPGLRQKGDPRPFTVDSNFLGTQSERAKTSYQIVCSISCYSWPCEKTAEKLIVDYYTTPKFQTVDDKSKEAAQKDFEKTKDLKSDCSNAKHDYQDALKKEASEEELARLKSEFDTKSGMLENKLNEILEYDPGSVDTLWAMASLNKWEGNNKMSYEYYRDALVSLQARNPFEFQRRIDMVNDPAVRMQLLQDLAPKENIINVPTTETSPFLKWFGDNTNARVQQVTKAKRQFAEQVEKVANAFSLSKYLPEKLEDINEQ